MTCTTTNLSVAFVDSIITAFDLMGDAVYEALENGVSFGDATFTLVDPLHFLRILDGVIEPLPTDLLAFISDCEEKGVLIGIDG